MHRTVERHVARWQALPLCCRYLVAQFESQELRARKSEPHRFVQWVFGTLRTGESEVLGLWLREALDWETVVQDLRLRGVVSIRFVVSTESVELPVESLRATVTPSIDHLLRELPISARLRQTLTAAELGGAPISRCVAPVVRARLRPACVATSALKPRSHSVPTTSSRPVSSGRQQIFPLLKRLGRGVNQDQARCSCCAR